ncbi:MAG: terminase [Clostridiales bacterium]|nr:terminase [Clostridiales bacterium]
MLSNTATPYYYGKFRESVLRGEIPVNREVSLEMNRIDALIRDPDIWYDDEAVEGWIDFCERELTLTDGSPFHMLDTFKVWGEEVFGWYYFIEKSVYEPYPEGGGGHYVIKSVKKRLINKQYLIVGRGAAKSLYDTCIHAYFLVVDPDSTHQITTAPTIPLGDEVLSPLRTALAMSRGPLFKMLTFGSMQNTTGNRASRPKLFSSKEGIEYSPNNSLLEVRPMTIDKLQSMRVKIGSIDEWLSSDVREDVTSALEQTCSKVDDWLIILTSSEGTVRNGPGDDIKIELTKILRGEYYNPHVSIWWYKLDDLDEVGMPEMWPKANPNIGKTVSYETYQTDVERAENVPSARNDILAKRFGIPREGYTYFFTYDETMPQRLYHLKGMPCALGADLSQGDDFCSFSFLFPLPGGAFGIKTRNYISSKTLDKLPTALRNKYQEFMDEGSLIVLNGVILDLMQVYDELDSYIEKMEFDIRCFGYDPYNAKEFVERWASENGPFGIEKVIQGTKTESVPLGEIKKLAAEKLWIFNEGIMQFAMGNCIVNEDTNGNRKLLKKRYEAKIDPVAASMDAFIAYKNNQDAFE